MFFQFKKKQTLKLSSKRIMIHMYFLLKNTEQRSSQETMLSASVIREGLSSTLGWYLFQHQCVCLSVIEVGVIHQ